MKTKVKEIVDEIVWLSESSSPVVHDLSVMLQDILEDETIYTHAEVVDILNRKEGIETEES